MPEAPRIQTAPARQERRLVTALFADISGFSELTNRLDAEQLLEIIDPAIAALSDVVARYDGVIEKFAGDALMALFGAPVAHDDDAARALHVAIDMHAELARLVPRLPAEAAGLRLHVGVNSGHGIGRVIGSQARIDYGVLGDVVVLAQRLEAAAPTGQTYVGETTYELTRKEFEFESLGELAVKGKDHPVRAWRLTGPRRRRTAPAGPETSRRLVGREAELEALSGFCARLRGGRGGGAFVVGEPGVGKSALCEALRSTAEAEGWEWLEARCLSYGASLPYWPIADLVRRLLGAAGAEAPAMLQALRAALATVDLEETLPFVAALCGVEGETATDLTPQTFQTRMHESVVAILRARASRRPVVLHVDDLQWADGSTVALLRDVMSAAPALPLVLLAAARPQGEALLEELADPALTASLRVDLAPLGGGAVAAIAGSVLGGAVHRSLADDLLARTQGNPFFVEELTRSLSERGALAHGEDGWRAAPDWDFEHVPVTVEGVIAARLDGLSDAERDALELLSVIGRQANLVIARAVAPGIDATVRGLRAAGLIEPGGDERVASFHHPLTHQVVHSRLLRRRRAQLHLAVGEAAEAVLGTDDGVVDLLARHFILGEQPAKAFEYSLRAAARAERLFANEQAVAYLRHALHNEQAATGSQEQRPSLLLRAARAEEVRGAYESALSLYGDALALTGGVTAAVGLAATLRKLGDYPACLAAIADARASHPELTADEAAFLAHEEGWVLGLTGDTRRALVVLRGGLADVEGRGSRIEADLLVVIARTESLLSSPRSALEHVEAARRILEASEDLPGLAVALRVLGGVQNELAHKDPSYKGAPRATLEEALRIARRVGNAEEEGAVLVNLARTLGEDGLVEEAIQADRDAASAFERVGLKAGVACAYCNLADHLHDVGRWEESLAAAERGLAVAREIGSAFWHTGALIGIANARAELGDLAGADAAAGEAADLATAHAIASRAATALANRADIRRRLGDEAAAEAMSAQADALRSRAG